MFDFLEMLGGWSLLNLWLPILVWTLLAWPIYLWLSWCGRLGEASLPDISDTPGRARSPSAPRSSGKHGRSNAARRRLSNASRQAWRPGLHPLKQQAIRQALLLALPLSMAILMMLPLLPEAPVSRVLPRLITLPPVLVSSSAVAASAWTVNGYQVLGLFMVFAGLFSVYRLSVLAASAVGLRRFRHSIPPALINGENAATAIVAHSNARRRIDVACVSEEVMPMTFGFTRPLIVLPEALLADEERLRMTLAHELVHVRRGDYLAQWIEQIVAALFAIHPLAHVLRHSIVEWREQACDAAVLDEPRIRPAGYAALLRDAAILPTPARSAIATPVVAFATNPHHLKTRINAMKNYTKHLRSSFSPRKAGWLLGFSLFAVAAVLVACTEVVDVAEDQPGAPPPPVASQHHDTPPPPPMSLEGIEGSVYKVVEDMPQLQPSQAEALKDLQECVQYPHLAAQAGIEGMVFVGFIVDDHGQVTNAQVLRGIGGGTGAEAVRCVNKVLRFSPGSQNGSPANVQMSIPVRFVLDGSPDASASL